MKEEANSFDIKCPRCKKTNQVNFSKPIYCQHCQEIITKKKPRRKLAFFFIAIAISFGSGHAVDDFYEDNRYPVEEEYAIIENCLNSSGGLVQNLTYKKKYEICQCALKKTQKIYFYTFYKNNKMEFIKRYRENIKSCYISD